MRIYYPLLSLVFLLSAASLSAQSEQDTLVFLFSGNPDSIVFIPEIEDLLEDLEIIDPDRPNRRFAVVNIMRLLDAERAQNVVTSIQRYYDSFSLIDERRDTIYRIIQPFLGGAQNLLQVKINLVGEVFFFEFIRYRILPSEDEINYKLLYQYSATSVIDLREINRTDIKDRFRNAIYKVFPSTNQRPEAYIQANGRRVGDQYYFGIGDTIQIFGRGKDYDSPESDFSYRWELLSDPAQRVQAVPLKSNIAEQELVLQRRDSFTIGLTIDDRINPSELAYARFHVLEKPVISGIQFENRSRRTTSYYWNFKGRPHYYEGRDSLPLAFSLRVDNRYLNDTFIDLDISLIDSDVSLVDLNIPFIDFDIPIISGPQFSAQSVPLRSGASFRLTDFQFVYNGARFTTDGALIEGSLQLPETTLPAQTYQFQAIARHYDIGSAVEPTFFLDLIRVNRVAVLFETQLGFLPTADNLQESNTHFNLGLSFRISERFYGYLLPGFLLLPNEEWELNARGGLEWDLLFLPGPRSKRFGAEIGGAFTREVSSGGRTQGEVLSLLGKVYFKHFLSKEPLTEMKYGFFYESFDNNFISDMMGVSVGVRFNSLGRKRRQ